MVFSFLTPENIYARYQDSKRHTELLTEPFPEFVRIARNKPHDGIDPRYPKTTDGTTAATIRKTPRRVIQQLPTGKVESDDDNDWLTIVAEFVYTHKILPYANEEYDLIQKFWSIVETSLTIGACPVYTPFLNHNGYFCPDLTIPYWGDIFLQKGKKSGPSCNYLFLRSWWNREDIEALIDQEKRLAKSARQRGDKYEAAWDITALGAILDAETLKDDKAQTPSESDRSTNPSGIELVTGMQEGVDATFFTFSPAQEVIVRRKKNKDPRGKMPISWMYGDIDGSNPWGRGIVELVGGLQNLIDSDMQMYQFNRALMLAPPVIKRGTFSKSKIIYAPNVIIDVGTDQQASVEPLTIDTSAVVNYPQLYGLQKSQLLNLVSSPDTSISAEVGNPGFGKTPEALSQQQAIISVDDNYIRKMFEACFEDWSETAINLYFAERTGVEELQLDKETATRLRKLADEGKFDPALLSEDDKLRIDYDTSTPALKFRVDASTSKMKDDSEQLAALTGLLSTLESSQILQQVIPTEKILATWNSIVAVSRVEDPENLTIDIDDFKAQQKAQAEQMAQEQATQAASVAQTTKAPTQIAPEDAQIIQDLQQLGISDDLVLQAMDLLEQGRSADEILAALGAVTNV